MKLGIVIGGLTLIPVAVLARETPDIDRLRNLTATIASNPSVAGQWIELLPAIARRCERVVDQERVTLLVDGFAHPEAVDEAADYFASESTSGLKVAWDAIAQRDEDAACRLADGLWGETGTQAPGVLRDTPRSAGLTLPQPVGEGRTPDRPSR